MTHLILHELLAGLMQSPSLVRHKLVFLSHLLQQLQSLCHLGQHGCTLVSVLSQLATVVPGKYNEVITLVLLTL